VLSQRAVRKTRLENRLETAKELEHVDDYARSAITSQLGSLPISAAIVAGLLRVGAERWPERARRTRSRARLLLQVAPTRCRATVRTVTSKDELGAALNRVGAAGTCPFCTENDWTGGEADFALTRSATERPPGRSRSGR
jgi:hypothetical protein